MGFFGKLFKGLSKAASTVANVALKAVDKTMEVASLAANKFIDVALNAATWAVDKLSGSTYDGDSIESRKGVERTLATFRADIDEQAKEAEETSINLAMNCFDEFADTLEDFFPELVDLVRTRQSETEDMLTHTIVNYAQEHISENDPDFQKILQMEPGEGKKEKMSACMQSIIDEAQNYFGQQLKKHIHVLNEELNVRLNQKIDAQEKVLRDTEEKYKVLSEQQTREVLDIQKVEEEYMPTMEAAFCIQAILEREDKNEHMVGNRSGRPKRSRKSGRTS